VDLVGKTVRWTSGAPGDDTWFTAEVIGGYDDEFGGWDGMVVDQGTFRFRDAPGGLRRLGVDEFVFLQADRITVIDSGPVTEDEECE
jgi:hypothetical protein